MRGEPLFRFHQMLYGREVAIMGCARGEGTNLPLPCDRSELVEFSINSVYPPKNGNYNIWLDNGVIDCDYSDNNILTLRAAHLGIYRSNEMLFLSGPMSDDQMTFAPPELLIDNAWHKSLSFSPLAGVVALEKVRHTAASKIHMVGMNLYNGEQEKAFAHNLKANALYISYIAGTDSRVVLCDALRTAITKITGNG